MLFRALALGRRQVARSSNFISLETVKIDRKRLLNLTCLLYQREPRMLLKIFSKLARKGSERTIFGNEVNTFRGRFVYDLESLVAAV